MIMLSQLSPVRADLMEIIWQPLAPAQLECRSGLAIADFCRHHRQAWCGTCFRTSFGYPSAILQRALPARLMTKCTAEHRSRFRMVAAGRVAIGQDGW